MGYSIFARNTNNTHKGQGAKTKNQSELWQSVAHR